MCGDMIDGTQRGSKKKPLAVARLHVLEPSVCARCGTVSVHSVLKQGVYELCIHETSSELVKIAKGSRGDSDISIYFQTLFLANVHACVRAHANRQ